jgi:hypothetical protein
MRRTILGLTVSLGLLAALGVANTAAATAGWAAAPVSTTVVLSCDRGVGTATATVQLQNSFFDPAFDTVVLSCGPDSQSGLKSERTKVVTGSAGWISYNISVTNIVGTAGCVGAGVAGTVNCGVDPISWTPSLGGFPHA